MLDLKAMIQIGLSVFIIIGLLGDAQAFTKSPRALLQWSLDRYDVDHLRARWIVRRDWSEAKVKGPPETANLFWDYEKTKPPVAVQYSRVQYSKGLQSPSYVYEVSRFANQFELSESFESTEATKKQSDQKARQSTIDPRVIHPADFLPFPADKISVKLLGKEPCGKQVCFILQAEILSEKDRTFLDLTSRIYWVDSLNGAWVKIVEVDAQGDPKREVVAKQIQRVSLKKNLWLPRWIRFKSLTSDLAYIAQVPQLQIDWRKN